MRRPSLLMREGAYGAVRAHPDVENFIRTLRPPLQAQLVNTMDKWAQHGPAFIPEGKFRSFVGRFAEGTGRSVAVAEFKAEQVRLFGVEETDSGGHRILYLTAQNPAKKKQKMDRSYPEKAARVFGEMNDG